MSNRPSLPALLALVTVCAGALLAVKPAGGADAAAEAAAPAAHTARHGPTARPKSDLLSLYATLATKRFVDLTHSFGPDTPHWKGFGEMRVRTLYTIAKDGFHVDEFCHVGQWGTHVDPPAHFHEGKKSVDQIDPKDMLMPLVVLDVHDKAARNPDYLLTLEDVQAWEARHGRIPEHAFVAMRTDWSKRWPNDAAMQNRDAAGVAHYPGWSMPVLKGRLFDGVVRPRHQPLSDRDARGPRPGARVRRSGDGDVSQTGPGERLSGARDRNPALKLPPVLWDR